VGECKMIKNVSRVLRMKYPMVCFWSTVICVSVRQETKNILDFALLPINLLRDGLRIYWFFVKIRDVCYRKLLPDIYVILGKCPDDISRNILH